MRHVLALLLIILWGSVAAAAQIPLPQTIGPPAFAVGIDAQGNLVPHIATVGDIATPNPQTASNSDVFFGGPQIQFGVADLSGLIPGSILFIQVIPQQENFAYCVITDITSGLITCNITFIQGGGAVFSQFAITLVNGYNTNSAPPWGGLGVDGTTDLAFPSVGSTISLTLNTGKSFTAGAVVYGYAYNDPINTYWIGVVLNYNIVSGAASIYIAQASTTGSEQTGYSVSLLSTLAPFVPILGFSGTTLSFSTGGNVVMTVSLPGSVVGGNSGADIVAGGVVNMTTQTGLLLNNSHIVVSNSLDSRQYFRGIGQYVTGTGAIKIYITDVHAGGAVAAISSWSLFAQDGPPVNADQIAVSQSSATLGAGDFPFTVQANQNFPTQGPVTLTALANPLNQMLGTIKAYNGTSLIVTVLSSGVYGSGTFTAWSILNTGPAQTHISPYQMNGLAMTASTYSGCGGCTSIINIQGGSIRDSTDTVDLAYAGGLHVIGLNNNDPLSSTTVMAISGAGTITGNGTSTVAGTSTAFTTFFSSNGTLTDLNNQLTALGFSTLSFGTILGANDSGNNNFGFSVQTITNNTSMTVDGSPSALTIGAYVRGGPKFGSGAHGIVYGIYLARKDADGTVAPFAGSFTPTGAPDLPAGYTYYRVIGYVGVGAANISFIAQPLVSNPLTTVGDILYFGQGTIQLGNVTTNFSNYLQRLGIGATGRVLGVSSGLPAWLTFASLCTAATSSTFGCVKVDNSTITASTGVITTANTTVNGTTCTPGGSCTPPAPANSLTPTAVYSATITPTALGINESSCNTSTGVVTFASDFSASLTASGQSVVLTGTVSTGYTTGTAYYVHIASNVTLTTWTNYSDAVAGSGASQVKCSVNNNSGWSLRWFAYSSAFNVGFSTIAPIGGTSNASANMAFDLNLTNALATTLGAVNYNFGALVDSAAANATNWIMRGDPTFSSTTLILLGNGNVRSLGNTAPGTWAQQSTTPITVRLWVWGALDEPIPANDNDLQLREVA